MKTKSQLEKENVRLRKEIERLKSLLEEAMYKLAAKNITNDPDFYRKIESAAKQDIEHGVTMVS